MAISAPVNSNSYLDYLVNQRSWSKDETPGGVLYEMGTSLVFSAAGFTSAAAGDIKLMRMPAGRLYLRTDLTRIISPQGTATSDLDVGVGAYTNAAGGAVSLNGNQFLDSLDVGGAVINQTFATTPGSSVLFDSLSGFDIVCSFDTANSPSSGSLILIVVYSR